LNPSWGRGSHHFLQKNHPQNISESPASPTWGLSGDSYPTLSQTPGIGRDSVQMGGEKIVVPYQIFHSPDSTPRRLTAMSIKKGKAKPRYRCSMHPELRAMEEHDLGHHIIDFHADLIPQMALGYLPEWFPKEADCDG